ncbi:MAG: type II and III secretion system family protein, partial [Alphaproteobacteria bacterium]|nr:type II and III secretion system family protein [Alphaproteobacteria bacterium]
SIDIPAPTPPEARRKAINEAPDGVIIVPLGKDVLVPAMDEGDPLPNRVVGPFELRNENLAGALQLVMADYDVPLAFESDKGMTVGVTVSNLKGPLDKVVEKICALADMYCLYDDGVLTVKENQTFTVSLPPLPADTSYDAIVSGLKAFTGAEGTVDTTTRTMIYTATERTAKKAAQYFDRLRKSTAMIVYETYIWEVGLDGGNSAGIKWTQLEKIGAFNTGFTLSGSALSDLGTPISIGLPTKGPVSLTTGDILQFISSQGSVKTISQPQLTVLSGSEATLRVAETEAYVESLTRTQNTTNDTETVSTTTGQVDTGFTLKIGSSWDNGTVYGNVDINLQQLLEFQDFPAGNDSTLRLPKTAERELQTQVRVRPGDSVLIAGLVRERQQYDKTGLGLNNPIFPFSRSGQTSNSELVILLRPRVIVYKPADEIALDPVDRARTSLVHADVPEVAPLSVPEGVPSSTFKKDIVTPQPYDPAELNAEAEAEEKASKASGNGNSLKAEDMDPAASAAASEVTKTPVDSDPTATTDAPKVEPTPAATTAPAAKNTNAQEGNGQMGTLPSTLLDPSLGETP